MVAINPSLMRCFSLVTGIPMSSAACFTVNSARPRTSTSTSFFNNSKTSGFISTLPYPWEMLSMILLAVNDSLSYEIRSLLGINCSIEFAVVRRSSLIRLSLLDLSTEFGHISGYQSSGISLLAGLVAGVALVCCERGNPSFKG
jgi:hypothetical protein